MQHRYLFLDLHHITRIEGLYRRMHQPRRHPENPILRGENPWETVASLYGTVLYDPQDSLFKMWYLTGPYADRMVEVRRRKALGNITLLAYATSIDGVHWEKPVLNQVDFAGSTANNLVDVGRTNCEGMAVLYDARETDPERRYKGFYWEHGGLDVFVKHPDGRLLWGSGEGDGMWVSFSPDGIHWTNYERNPVIPLGSDTTQSLVWDAQRQKYVVFGRFGAGGRKIARAESDDCIHFSEPKRVFECDAVDEAGTQFYGMPVNRYEGMYLGMVWMYREGVDGTIDTSLATSRDGINWERVLDRQTFLPLGQPGSWEDGMVRISQNFITREEQLFLYYGGVNGPHTGRKFKQVERSEIPIYRNERKHKSMLGLATLRRDGFVSLDAGNEEGHTLTKPLTLDGRPLHVNVDGRKGYIVVAITDDKGAPLVNYTSTPIVGDRLDASVPFNHTLEALKGKEVRLRFQLKGASLYSYWFA
ncbi:hypothetical protein HYR99_32125 [Candidatus Poribacteria bacterium]|nr:hypothetical protein [Candidatus Poribacteria bacterium]